MTGATPTTDSTEDECFELVPEDALLTELEAERCRASELLDRLKRLQADFENYKKRMAARFEEVTKYAAEAVLFKLLEVHDNIVRALEVDFSSDPEAAKKGIEAIERQIMKILEQEQVRPIESVGRPFDPYYQHAVHKEYRPDEEDGIVLEEYQKGYMIREKVLRPALVCVNRHEPPEGPGTSTDDDSSGSGDTVHENTAEEGE